MKTISMPRMLLIAGTGRNVGKTTLACEIIQHVAKTFPVIGIKISYHFHKKVTTGGVIVQRKDLYIGEETDRSVIKDSSRFLASGAVKSYFVMAADNQLMEAVGIITQLNKPDDLYVCESGGLRNWITPGLFLMVHNETTDTIKPEAMQLKNLCDRWIVSNGKRFDFDLQFIEVLENSWHLKNTK